MFQYIINLVLTYFFAMMLSGGILAFLTIKGKIGRKIKGLSFTLIPLIALFWWGTKIDPQYYKWWFVGIVLINLVFQYRHEKRRQRMQEATNQF